MTQNVFNLTVRYNASRWSLTDMQQLRCMYWMGVPTPVVAETLRKTARQVQSKAAYLGVYRPDWVIARNAAAARARPRG